ncbi:MAG: nucleotidyltransferase domain-containing protein [Thermodesulfobacteriota bacterium]|jgi:predicted nucleotidyltransferase
MKKKVRQLIDSLLPYEPERLYLFGSWARREEDELSDMDVVVIKDTPSPFFDRLHEVSTFLPAEIGGLDILVYTPEEFTKMLKEGNAFAEMITEEASLIYDREAKI